MPEATKKPVERPDGRRYAAQEHHAQASGPLILHVRRSAHARSLLVSEPFAAELCQRLVGLLKPPDVHAAGDSWSLHELNVVVVDDLDVVAPRVHEVERPRRL